MKKLRKLSLASIAATVVMFATPAPASAAYGELVFQGVTFSVFSTSNTLQLTITGALNNATGNWADVQYLKAFEIKDIGIVDSAQVVSASFGSWLVDVNHGVNNGSGSGIGCTSGNTQGACFYQAGPLAMIPISDVMSFTLSFSGSNLNLDMPSLKVQFLTNSYDTSATGSLLSLPIPEPEIYAMMGIGLGVLGWSARRKKLNEAAAS